MTEADLKRILNAGADVITTGNHIWEKRDFWPILDTEERILRPANYPEGAAGRGLYQINKNGVNWTVINLQGREYMTPIDCPFRRFDAIYGGLPGNADADSGSLNVGSGGPNTVILVDFHAESTREKEALAYHIDGRASVLVGTHTHVQTADEKILPQGTAYITDLGMTGVTSGIIGMDPKICLDRARTQVLFRMETAKPTPDHGVTGRGMALKGIIAEINAETGKALSIKRIA
jgi:metallophosphoesterase (TIGR00282 family)